LLALKIAKTLESFDKTGRVVMIDGSPDFINALAKNLFPHGTNQDEQMKNYLQTIMVKTIEPSIDDKFMMEIIKENSIEKKMKKLCDKTQKEIPYSLGYLEEFSEAILNRYKIALEIDDKMLSTLNNTTITLMKSSEISLHKFVDDYGLSKYSTQVVKTHTIAGNHLSILKNDELLNIINEHINGLIKE
jgi:hypothetical protein